MQEASESELALSAEKESTALSEIPNLRSPIGANCLFCVGPLTRAGSVVQQCEDLWSPHPQERVKDALANPCRRGRARDTEPALERPGGVSQDRADEARRPEGGQVGAGDDADRGGRLELADVFENLLAEPAVRAPKEQQRLVSYGLRQRQLEVILGRDKHVTRHRVPHPNRARLDLVEVLGSSSGRVALRHQ